MDNITWLLRSNANKYLKVCAPCRPFGILSSDYALVLELKGISFIVSNIFIVKTIQCLHVDFRKILTHV